MPTAHAAGGEGVVLVAAALGLGISRVRQSSRFWNEYRDFLELDQLKKRRWGGGKAVSGLRSGSHQSGSAPDSWVPRESFIPG